MTTRALTDAELKKQHKTLKSPRATEGSVAGVVAMKMCECIGDDLAGNFNRCLKEHVKTLDADVEIGGVFCAGGVPRLLRTKDGRLLQKRGTLDPSLVRRKGIVGNAIATADKKPVKKARRGSKKKRRKERNKAAAARKTQRKRPAWR